ncbi:hypothetical protein L226DRAFT_99274 [Lentinus tigrinus ALCF2SS1-7]|uniref:FAR-17a/AIG1-like protein n=1 Tax=Lentinus tigrinus ALCF2SS1-6 TaxID=1328759 RepID=A0A5C2S5P2_9APHY|nr:hypothetical protein L227DRAFT_163052 [Lentinus tigrinus ALCF2SS1-6]RPD73436.1 hypothetical protein L226DRAFT_99274 [Lentinus tigrinus ALCF2SS1-7]
MSTKQARAGFYPRLGVTSPFDAHHDLVTSPVFSPLVLALLRLTLATYALFVALYQLIWEAVREDGTANGYFSYFTHLSYIGLIAYQFAAGVQTLCYALNGQSSYPLQRWPRFLQFLHRFLYSTVTTYPLVVTVIFWSLLSDSSTFESTYSTWINISEHALNTVYALLEITLTSVAPSPWLYLPLCVFTLACYLGVAYITEATQGFYTYSFLDPGKEHAKLAGYIIAVGIAECLAFLLARGLAWVRDRLSKRSSAIRPGSPDSTEQRSPSEDWEEIERPSMSIGHAV